MVLSQHFQKAMSCTRKLKPNLVTSVSIGSASAPRTQSSQDPLSTAFVVVLLFFPAWDDVEGKKIITRSWMHSSRAQ